MKTNIILQGDALKKLKELKEKSVDMVMTSPPYWALRDYGKGNETIWDEKEECEHDFDIKERKLHGGTAKNTIHGAILAGGLEVDWRTKDGFCNKCGAWKGQLGLEPTFDLYIKHLCDIFDEVKRCLKDEGVIFVNIGDTYYTKSGSSFENDNLNPKSKEEVAKTTGINKDNELRGKGLLKEKNLTLIPFRFVIEMQNRGWIIRNVIIWEKPSCMPDSANDRFTPNFEYVFFFSKQKKYYFNTPRENNKLTSIKRTLKKWDGHREKGSSYEGMDMKNMCHPDGRKKRCVWRINPQGSKKKHYAVYPEKLCEIPIQAGCPEGGIVLDPFGGFGTTGLVARKQGKNFILIELNQEYIKMANERLKGWVEQTRL